MKKVLLAATCLLVLALIGIAVFVATFDADRYRPLLVRELQRSIGKPVTLERVTLGWRHGIAVRLQGLTIAEETADTELLLHVESASALVRLAPLLRKEIDIASVVLQRPRIHAARDPQGRVNLPGLPGPRSDGSGMARQAGLAVAATPSAVSVGDAALSFSIASVAVEDGAVHWTDAMSSPPTDLWLRALDVTVRNIAPGRPMDVELKGAVAGQAPNLHITGRLTLPSAGLPGSLERLKLTLTDVPIEQLVRAAHSDELQLRGRVSVAAEGAVPTLDPSQLVRALSVSGHLKLADPVVANLNVLREVFTRLSIIPGLVERLESRLPPEYQAKLAARDTILAPIDLSMRVESGSLRFDTLELRTETFGLSGAGTVGLDGTVALRAVMRINPALSAAIIRSVKELSALADADGELELPLVIQGHAPRVAVVPDLHYVASKVIVTKVEDLIGSLLEKAIEKRTTPDAPANPPQP